MHEIGMDMFCQLQTLCELSLYADNPQEAVTNCRVATSSLRAWSHRRMQECVRTTNQRIHRPLPSCAAIGQSTIEIFEAWKSSQSRSAEQIESGSENVDDKRLEIVAHLIEAFTSDAPAELFHGIRLRNAEVDTMEVVQEP